MKSRMFPMLAAACLATAFSVSSVSAFVVVEEYTFPIERLATPWQHAVNVPYFDPSRHGGLELQEVTFTLSGEANSGFDVSTPVGGGIVTVSQGRVGAYIRATGQIDGLELDVLPSGTFAPPTLIVQAGETRTLTNVSGSDQDSMIMTGPENVMGFVQATETATYIVDIDSIGTSNLSTSGGNWDASQRTTAQATLTVTYSVVPEPVAGVLLVSGLCASLLVYRRKRS